jgi:hypothetical protein
MLGFISPSFLWSNNLSLPARSTEMHKNCSDSLTKEQSQKVEGEELLP